MQDKPIDKDEILNELEEIHNLDYKYSDGRIYATDLDFKNFKEHAIQAAQYWLTQRQWFNADWNVEE